MIHFPLTHNYIFSILTPLTNASIISFTLNSAEAVKGEVMSTSAKRNRRKRFFNFSVERNLQWRMLLKIWGIILATALVACTIFFYYSYINVEKSYPAFHVKADNFWDLLLPVLLIGFFASLVLGVVASLFFPHAVAGPIYSIERELVDIGRGDLRKEIRIRKGDELKDLTDSFNVMIREFKDKIKTVNDISEQIGEIVARAEEEGSDETVKKIKVASANLQEAVKQFEL